MQKNYKDVKIFGGNYEPSLEGRLAVVTWFGTVRVYFSLFIILCLTSKSIINL